MAEEAGWVLRGCAAALPVRAGPVVAPRGITGVCLRAVLDDVQAAVDDSRGSRGCCARGRAPAHPLRGARRLQCTGRGPAGAGLDDAQAAAQCPSPGALPAQGADPAQVYSPAPASGRRSSSGPGRVEILRDRPAVTHAAPTWPEALVAGPPRAWLRLPASQSTSLPCEASCAAWLLDR